MSCSLSPDNRKKRDCRDLRRKDVEIQLQKLVKDMLGSFDDPQDVGWI